MKQFIGPLIILTSTFLYALLQVLLKKSDQSIKPFTIMAISMFSLFFSSLLVSIFLEGGLKLNFSHYKESILILLLVGLINAVAFWLFLLGFKYMPLWQQMMYTLLTPVIVGVLSVYILGEPLNYKLFIGLIFMGIGLFITFR